MHQYAVDMEREEAEMREEIQLEEEAENTDDISNSQYVEIPEKEPVVTKRGRPSKKRPAKEKDPTKEWDDTEVELLIALWSQCDALVKYKQPEYHNRDERSKAFNFIQAELQNNGITATPKQISEKMTSLRTYFGAEKRKLETSKKAGAGRNEVSFSKWRFYESLMFLADSFSPKPTESNLPHGDTTPGSGSSSSETGKRKKSQMDEIVPIMKAALNKMDILISNEIIAHTTRLAMPCERAVLPCT